MMKIKILLVAIVVIAAGGFIYNKHHQNTLAKAANKAANVATEAKQKVTQELNSHCSSNTSGQEVIISISKQHMWACDGTKTVYDNAVITGMEMYPADLTPTGTYQVYAKATDQTLAGSDNTGSWSDHVDYWMPFLSNKYGVYGFHDATWRSNNDFGNININAPFTTTAKSASHGCVELPLGAAKWLYDWAPVGTAVVVQS